MEAIVQRNEILYRGIKRSMKYCLTSQRKISPALFTDNVDGSPSLGISVDRDGGRSDKGVIQAFETRWGKRFKGLAKFNADICIDEGIAVIPKPSQENKFHAELYGDESGNPLSLLNMVILSDYSELVYFNEDVEWT